MKVVKPLPHVVEEVACGTVVLGEGLKVRIEFEIDNLVSCAIRCIINSMNLRVVFEYMGCAVAHKKTKVESLYPLLVLVSHLAGAGLYVLEDRYLYISAALEQGT